MVRPIKWRKVECMPSNTFYGPSDKLMQSIDTNSLLLEELEAIRLKDLEGLEQNECAQKMEVSRPTFQRILLSAHKKIADALVNGKQLHISGGNYTKNICSLKCDNCNTVWKESIENMNEISKGKYICPKCGSPLVECSKKCSCGKCRRMCHI